MVKHVSYFVIIVVLLGGIAVDKTQAEVIIWGKDGSKMALIPAGSFEMGDHFKEGYDDGRELPVHTVDWMLSIWMSMRSP